jgi:hypothetical protein
MLDNNLQGLNYTKELEDEVEKCIQRLFKNLLSVDEFCDILARFKDSHDKKEKVRGNILNVLSLIGVFKVFLLLIKKGFLSIFIKISN